MRLSLFASGVRREVYLVYGQFVRSLDWIVISY